MAQFSELSEDVILHIFSFIPFRLLRRTICRVCKMWHRIASDPAIVRKASSHEFESIRLCDTINDRQLKNLVKRIVWARTEDIIVFDLAKTSISRRRVQKKSLEKVACSEHCQTCHFRIPSFHHLGESS